MDDDLDEFLEGVTGRIRHGQDLRGNTLDTDSPGKALSMGGSEQTPP
ncbi:MAG: hypothetical protein ACSLFJ_09215 [Immundisolibacter sp.]